MVCSGSPCHTARLDADPDTDRLCRLQSYRQSLGLLSLNEIYNTVSYVYLTNPLDGLITNLRWFFAHLFDITSLDLWALI